MARRKEASFNEETFRDIEAHLAGTLRPVHPSGELIQQLRDRLRFPDRAEIVLRISDWKRMMLVLGGVMSGMLLIITIARALFHLFGRRHM